MALGFIMENITYKINHSLCSPWCIILFHIQHHPQNLSNKIHYAGIHKKINSPTIYQLSDFYSKEKNHIFLKITHLVFLHQSLVMHHSQGLCQDLEGRGLPSEGIPNNHQTMTYQDHIIDLKTNQNPIIPFIKINLQTTLFIL